jgi:hypothetical protein
VKEYQVVLVDKKQQNADGFLESLLWEKANCLTDFCSPWEEEAFSKMEFRALWDLENLFFKFRVFDTDLYIDKKDDSIDSIGNSDRVELFFRTDKELSPYYCLEMDTAARLMDFKAYPDKNFDFDWKWPKEDLELKASQDAVSYSVEGRISLKSLQSLNLVHNNSIETGVFRAKFSPDEHQEYQPTWMPWVNPNTETPNFHIASSFGKFILMS